MKARAKDNRPVVLLRQFAGKWEMKVPSSGIPAARQWRVIPDWPGFDRFVAACDDNGFRVERA